MKKWTNPEDEINNKTEYVYSYLRRFSAGKNGGRPYFLRDNTLLLAMTGRHSGSRKSFFFYLGSCGIRLFILFGQCCARRNLSRFDVWNIMCMTSRGEFLR